MLPDRVCLATVFPGGSAGTIPPDALLDRFPDTTPFALLPSVPNGALGVLPFGVLLLGVLPRGPDPKLPLYSPGTAAPGIVFIPPGEEGWPVPPPVPLPPYGPPRYQPPVELPRGLLPAPVPLFAPLLPEPAPPFGLLADAARMVRLSLWSW